MEYQTSTELELLQGYFTEFNGMLSDIAEDLRPRSLRDRSEARFSTKR